MARPRTPIGTFGEIHVEKTRDGRARALTRFRDYDGQLRRVRATADTPKAAERKLKEMLAERTEQKAGQGDLTSASSFRHLVDVWLADLDLEDALAPSTRALYERNMRQLVLPAFEHHVLAEVSVRKVDQFIKTLAKTKSYAGPACPARRRTGSWSRSSRSCSAPRPGSGRCSPSASATCT